MNGKIAIAIALLVGGCAGTPESIERRSMPSGEAAQSEMGTRLALAMVERHNPRLNAVIAIDPTAIDQARAIDARIDRGPLDGLPVLVKDNIETAGPLPTTAGSLALVANVSGRDAPLVARLRQAGAVILGKTNLSEWANIRDNESISGWSALGGQVRNPYALDRNPCGSSSGSAVAVAAGIVLWSVGTETDGSITCPAAVNGVVGFKPTVGLVSRTGIIPISASQDTAGPMAMSVRDTALLLTAMAGSDPADPATAEADRRKVDYAAALDADSLRGRRIGVMRFSSGFGTDEALEAALAVLIGQGAQLVEIKEGPRRSVYGDDEFKVLLTEFKAGLNAYLANTPPSVSTRSLADIIAFNRAHAIAEMPLFGQDIFEEAEQTKGLDDPDYLQARAASLKATGEDGIDKLLRQYRVEALVGPTMPPAWKIDAVNGDQISGGGAGGLAAVAGYPHLTVPMGLVKGLPVGLSFIGAKWSDALILSLGHAFERARGPFPLPQLIESIEERPDIARALAPARR